MKTAWTEAAWHDYLHWQKADERMRARIDELIRDINGVPFKGLGRPEPLQHALKGWSSRRIFGQHRLVYRVSGKGREQRLEIAQCRYCY
ncbi:MAG: toxin YoeB [Bradyrhizobium sp.]|jgi:toxin YoeB|nr:toxin YoeB [Bradyrhizobium sp.]